MAEVENSGATCSQLGSTDFNVSADQMITKTIHFHFATSGVVIKRSAENIDLSIGGGR